MKRVHDDDLLADPILMPHQGRLVWMFPSGRMLPLVRGGDGPDDEKKHTDEDVNRIVEERLKRERAKASAEKVPADYDQFKADAAELATLKAANAAAAAAKLTEAEATAARFAALEADIKKANDATAAASAATLVEKRHSAIVAAAAMQKAASPNQVAALLKQDAVTIGDDGQVTGADEAVKAFLAENPHHVGTQQLKPDTAQGQRTGQPTPSVSAGRDMFAASRAKTAPATTTAT